jgi:protein TonB
MRIGGLAVAEGTAYAYDDPMSQVLGLDSQTTGPVAWLGYTLGAFALLLGLMVSARAITMLLATMNGPVSGADSLTQEIDVIKEEPPPPPAPTETEEKPEPAPPARVTPHEAPPPPAAPAQASKVLTQEPDPNEPVDLTGNTIVTGNAEAYAGGTTASNGTNTHAVRGLSSPEGAATAAGAAPAKPSGPDRSRSASVGGTEWNCPFPPEADAAQIDEAYVTLQVDVRADGSPDAVRVLSDPGNGFGREARRCAMSKHFAPAQDHDGNAIAGSVKPKVHFSR